MLEITESLLPEDGADDVIERLRQLKSFGVLARGRRFRHRVFRRCLACITSRSTCIKIDRSFLTGIERDRNKAQLVQGIVSLAESLDLVVIAEGLEDPAQAEQLRDMRAAQGQGYLFSPPVAPDRLWELLQDPAALAVAA